ncbi:MAG: NUDIX hydrolase [Candidatus Micrarchaeia archaeon]
MHRIFHTPLFDVGMGNFTANKKKATFYTVIERDFVTVLPIIGDKVLIEKQYRPALSKYIYELPAGHIERGESPRAAAKRELEEETGYSSSSLSFLAAVYMLPGQTKQKCYIFVAKNLSKKSSQKLDKDEIISVKEIKYKSLQNMIKSGKILDGKTVLAVAYNELLK